MKTLVTGATGLVGGAITRQLVQRGYQVRALVRSLARARHLQALGLELVEGDILDPASLRAACRGCNWLFHAAAIYEFWVPDPQTMVRTEVEGTRNVLEVARDEGISRVIYTSTAATVGEPRGLTGVEETPHRGYFLSRYERAKFEAEQLAKQYIAQGMDIVILKPAAVIGPGDLKPTGQALVNVLSGRLPAIVPGTLSLVYVEDVGLAHVLAAEKGHPGESYIVSAAVLSSRQLFHLACRLAGRRAPWTAPPFLALAFAWICELWASLRGTPPLLTREAVRTVAHGFRVDGSRAARELGFTYTPIEQALREALRWYWQQGLLPRKPAFLA